MRITLLSLLALTTRAQYATDSPEQLVGRQHCTSNTLAPCYSTVVTGTEPGLEYNPGCRTEKYTYPQSPVPYRIRCAGVTGDNGIENTYRVEDDGQWHVKCALRCLEYNAQRAQGAPKCRSYTKDHIQASQSGGEGGTYTCTLHACAPGDQNVQYITSTTSAFVNDRQGWLEAGTCLNDPPPPTAAPTSSPPTTAPPPTTRAPTTAPPPTTRAPTTHAPTRSAPTMRPPATEESGASGALVAVGVTVPLVLAGGAGALWWYKRRQSASVSYGSGTGYYPRL